MEIDTSYETPDYSGCCSPASGEDRKMKRVFPTLTIPNNMALAKAVSAGQEFTATVKLRVAEVMIRERADGESPNKISNYPGEGVRVEMEVQSISPQGISVKEGSNEENGSDALKKYFNKKAAAADNDGDE
jgi:hypothetical protein